MNVFSAFSGICATSVAAPSLGWTMVGYSEIAPFACTILAERYDATAPKYLADPDPRVIEEESYALLARLTAAERRLPAPARNWYARRRRRVLQKKIGMRASGLDKKEQRRLLDELLHSGFDIQYEAADRAIEERDRREQTLRSHEAMRVRSGGRVPNFGDLWSITDHDLEELGPVDVIVGGPPCQANSVAGRRYGLMDHRGAMMFGYADLIERMRRINGLKWVVYENVKGVLSDEENGFGHFLAALAGQPGHPLLPPGRKWSDTGRVSGPGGTMAWRVLDSQRFGVPQRRERVYLVAYLGDGSAPADPAEILSEPDAEAGCDLARDREGQAALSAACGGLELVVFMAGQSAKARSIAESATISPTLRSASSGSNQVPSVAYLLPEKANPLHIRQPALHPPAPCHIVRKLLPVECERLQGFPDGWTDVPDGNKAAKDGWRYGVLGNAMTVPVMRWIGERLNAAVEMATAEGKDAARVTRVPD